VHVGHLLLSPALANRIAEAQVCGEEMMGDHALVGITRP
jgi:hypothetical protein